MSSRQLRSPLHHAVPKSASRPPPLWQIAAGLDPAVVPATAAAAAVPEPSTSAVRAGWICVGIGMLTAWFFPLAHVFFSIAILLAVVAMATHQVRAGLLLLAGALTGIGICAILFVCGVAMLAAGALQAATKPPPGFASVPRAASTPRPAVPAVSLPRPVAREGTVSGNPLGNYTWQSDPAAAAPPSRVVVSAPALPMTRLPAAPVVMPTPVDYAARDRQIADLQKRIDGIDETIRQVRANPHWYGIVKNSTDTSRQQASDGYLDQLDKQRNDLRRQKWALEGR